VRRRGGPPRRSRGFTLLEVLLAFVIFALGFATVLEILGGSMRSTVRARDYTEAALLAQSLADMVGTEFPIEEGSLAGDAPGGYQWQLAMTLYESQDPDDRTLEIAEVTGSVLYWVDLEITWGDAMREHQVHFSTVRGIMQNFQQ
jgi:general secretion pathway protein I